MEFTGKFDGISVDWKSGTRKVTFTVNEQSAIESLGKMDGVEKLSIKAVKFREKRSLDANALLWKCLGEIASVIKADKWDVYLKMLRRYGKYTHICVHPSAVDSVKKMWRECEEIGEIRINGRDAVQLLCYFGSSTYDTKEMSVLLDGVLSEMKEMGLDTPPSAEMRRSLEQWEKMQHG